MARITLKHPPGEALRKLIRRELGAAAGDLGKPETIASVHGVRKRLKVARSLLRMARPAIGGKAFAAANAQLRDAARLLASARHAEALHEAITRLGTPRDEAEATALDGLHALAGAAHSANHAPGTVAEAAAAARALVLGVRKNAASWPIARRGQDPLLDGLSAAYRKARRLMRRGLRSGDGETLHEARKSVIHHLHHLEALEPVWPGLLKAWTAELTGLRAALGDLNDLDEMDRAVSLHGGQPAAAARAGAARLIDARREDLMGQVRRASGHLFAEKPSAFRRRMAAMWSRALD